MSYYDVTFYGFGTTPCPTRDRIINAPIRKMLATPDFNARAAASYNHNMRRPTRVIDRKPARRCQPLPGCR